MRWWYVGAAANVVIAFAYFAIAFSIGRSVFHQGRWRSNPLAVATTFIFLTCGVHHGSHSVHQLLPYFGLDEPAGNAMRTAFDSWHVSLWDVVTAAVGIWYWTLRGRVPAMVRGSGLFEDVEERRRQALEIHDNVVQGLSTAKLAFELNDPDKGMSALDESLAAARSVISDLLGDGDLPIGALRRHRPAGGQA